MTKQLSKCARKCSECGTLMNEGFYFEDDSYYCSVSCRQKVMTDEEYDYYYENDMGYYTAWENEEDFEYYENGEKI